MEILGIITLGILVTFLAGLGGMALYLLYKLIKEMF